MKRSHSTTLAAHAARLRRALRGATWQFVDLRRGTAWALVLRDGRRTPWLGERQLPGGRMKMADPESVFYRYFAVEVMKMIGVEEVDAPRARSLAPVVCRAKIQTPDRPFIYVVRREAS